MAIQQSPKIRLDVKRKIDQLNRVRSLMGLEIMRMHREPGCGTEDDFWETVDVLTGLEDELRDLGRQYEDGTSLRDCRD
jgi:hypothetical protein